MRARNHCAGRSAAAEAGSAACRRRELSSRRGRRVRRHTKGRRFTRRPPQTLSRAASWESVNGGKATTRARRLMPICRYFDGASRTRTGDLLGAIRARAALESPRFAGFLAQYSRGQPARDTHRLQAITGSLPPQNGIRGQGSGRSLPPLELPAGPDLVARPPPEAALLLLHRSSSAPGRMMDPPDARSSGHENRARRAAVRF
jgi:hypothetical protein